MQRVCSGDMYGGEPLSTPDTESWLSPISASPKSINFTSPRFDSMMFDGLRSRWATGGLAP